MLVLNTLSTLGNVIVLNFYGRDLRIEKEMPAWVKVFKLDIFLQIKLILTDVFKLEKLVCVYMAKLFRMKKLESNKIESSTEENMFVHLIKPTGESSDMQQVLNILNKLMVERAEADQVETNEIKWKYAALVLDRFFLFLSLVFFIICFTSIILPTANLYKPI